MKRMAPAWCRALIVGLLVLTSGCAQLGSGGSRSGGGTAVAGSAEGAGGAGMTQARMEQLFADEVDAIMGPPGAIQTRIDGVNVYLISDEANDRMRIVAPIAMLAQMDPRVLEIMLEANFHRTLDARYSTSEGVIYATFLHPLSSLSPQLLSSGLAQILSLAKTFGTQFSSGVLDFGGPREADPR